MKIQTADQVYFAAFKRGLAPEPALTVSEWADKHRVLSSVASGEPGQWRTARTPYLKEIMDCLSPSSPVERVVFMKGAQLGGTEAGVCWIGYVVHHAPGPMMMVQPTVEMAKSYSKQRIDPLIESSPTLSELIKPNRSRDSGNTIFVKEFTGGILRMVGANSASGLRSMPVRYLFMDEVDAYPGDVDGEGDPVALAIQRTVTFSNKKVLMVSTPTIKGFSRIEAAYQESDQRKYWVPCPSCDEMQVLEWSQVKWPEGRRDMAYYSCIHCGFSIQGHQKGWMLDRGQWRASATSSAGVVAGFHLSSLYSPLGWVSWADIAEEHGMVYKDPPRLKVWVNTKLGETWEEQAEAIDSSGLMDRCEEFSSSLNQNIVILTAGIDVQDDRIEVEVVGWGRDEESWSIDYRIIHGDPSAPTVWNDLDAFLRRSYKHSRQCGDLIVRAAAVDTGGHHTLRAYEFCRLRQNNRIWAIKGRGGAGVPIWPRRPTRSNKGHVPLFMVGVDTAKESIYARLHIRDAGPGCCHFPADRDEEWFKQLTAERVATRYHKGRPMREWIKRDSERNEALDCRVYAMASLYGMVSMGFQLNKEADKLAAIPLVEQEVVYKPQPQSRRRVIQSSWMK